MRESGNLSSFAESLKNSALEDLRGAQAIRNELALLGQRALDELKRDHVLEEAPPENRLMPKPDGPELETQRGPVAPHQVEPDVSPGITPDITPDVPEAIDTPPPTGGRGPRRRQVTPDRPVSTREETPAPPAAETGASDSTAADKAVTPPQPPVVEVGDVTPMSAAEQLRREFAAGAFPHDPQEGAAPVSPTRVERPEPRSEAPRNDPGTAAGAPEKDVAAPRPPMVSVEPTGGPIPMPSSPAAATDEAASDPLPATYTGRLYLMFPSSLGQEEIGSVWEILESIVAGSIVENRLVSRTAGIQFTLDLGSKEFSLEQLRKRMPGAKLEALGADRLKVDWPRTG